MKIRAKYHIAFVVFILGCALTSGAALAQSFPPVLGAIGSKSVTEGANLSFSVSATDDDGATPSLTTSSLPSNATFTDNGNGTGAFDFNPGYTQAGTYTVTFYANDAVTSDIDSEIVSITVDEAGNQPPVLAAIGNKSVAESSNLNFGVSASDPDATIPALTTSTLPSGAVFTDNGNGTGTFDWTPGYDQSNGYPVTFYASDGTAIDSEIITITVTNTNRDPVLDAIGNKTVAEAANLNFGITASDPDATIPVLTTSTLPSGAVFTDNGNGTGAFDWTPGYDQSGGYPVTFYASDGTAIDSEIVTITVTNTNRPPVLAAIGNKSVAESSNLNFGVTASDPDATIPALTTSTLPSGALFTDNGNGTGAFDWTPGYDQSGGYPVTFYASDGTAIDSEVITITVTNTNRPPVLSAIGAKSVNEGASLNFAVSAGDPDGQIPVLTTSVLPAHAAFIDNGNGTGAFSFNPDYTQSGTIPVTFYAGDGALVDSEVVAITVNEAGNQKPVLDPIGNQSVLEGGTLDLTVTASDAEQVPPVLTTSSLPTNATFTDNGDGTGHFLFMPAYNQAGFYNITFYATDDSASVDSEKIIINVLETGNQPPVWQTIGNKSTTEGVNLNFGVTATDPDATYPVLSTSPIPSGASFVDNHNGTGTFNWTPTYLQSGSFPVRFYATDGIYVDTEFVTITVIEAGNQPPQLAAIGNKTVTEGINLSFSVSATDPEAAIPALTTSTLPGGASFNDNGNGTGAFSWTPVYNQAGIYNITFYATDNLAAVDSEVIAITVQEAGNQAPVLFTVGNRSTTENVNLTFAVSSADPDSTIPALSTSTLPSGAGFTDNGNGTGTFSWTPGYTQTGAYPVTFYAGDGALVDSERVTITVTDAGNQPPVLNAIGGKSVIEGNNLNFGVSASDPDATIPTLTTSTLPSGAVFTDNGNGTGTFSWTPGYTQAGSYPVTFYAGDGALVDSEIITIAVTDAGNQPPVLAPIGAKSIAEGANLTFGVSASDPDATIPVLTTSTLPLGANFVDNGNGTGTLSWMPGYTQAGIYPVTFYAGDGSAVDSEIVTITVTDAGNQPPVLAPIGAKSIAEGGNLNFGVSASDPDATTPVLTSSTLPLGANLVDNGNGTGTFSWTPGYTQAGAYPVTFYAGDGALIDSEIVTITVTDAGNQPPVLNAIGGKSVIEGNNLNFSVSASDPDATIPALTTSTLPSGAIFTDNGNGTGAFNWTPGYTQAGSYPVTFYASDGALIDSEIVTITVTEAGNQPPVLNPIGAKSIVEGGNLAFTVTSSDPDGTLPVLSTSTPLPPNASFTDNGDGSGSFVFNPSYIQSGTYYVNFYATDGAAIDSELVAISVTEAGNQPPVLTPIGPKIVAENAALNFTVSATDPDATIPALSTSTLPAHAAFVDNGNGTGALSFSPDFNQAGAYPVTFYASDGALVDSEIVTITVNNTNRPPVLDPVGNKSVAEAANLNFPVTSSDPDATIPTLTTSTLPGGAIFTDNGNGTGVFDWTPTYDQSGGYPVTFYTSDGTAVDSEVITITVTNTNRAPVLDPIGNRTVAETANLSFTATASDPDGTIPSLTTSLLPSGATFVDNGNGSGAFGWTPGYEQSGSYPVTFYASDGAAIDSEVVTITVTNTNRPPVLNPVGNRSVPEGGNLNFTVTASDPDATLPALSISAMPTNASFVDNGNGTGTFNFNPDFTQAGSYPVTFYASDGAAIDSELITISVTGTNLAPVLAPIGAKSVVEGAALNFGVTAFDGDGTIPSLSTSTIPTNASFVDNGNGTGSFAFSPTYTQAGVYPVTFYATDGVDTDSEVVAITVTEAGNQSPVLAAIGNKSVAEAGNLNFVVIASDPDATIPALTTSALPSGATFTDNGNGTGSFDWTPGYTQSGVYPVTFYAGDGSLVDSELITITVTDAGNQSPVLAAIGNKSVAEASNLNFGVTASDPDATIPALTTSTLPGGATFTDNGNGTGTFDWTPGYTQAGVYPVTFFASDGALVDSEVVTITVTDAGNQPPVLAAIGNKSVAEASNLNFGITASDPDATIPALTTSTLPSGAIFTDNGNGTGAFNWTPGYTQSGVYPVTFYASDGSMVDSEAITITVTESGNQSPRLNPIGARSVIEGGTLSFTVTSSDPDATIPALTTSTLPSGAAFTDNGNGSGGFSWIPGYTQAGIYPVTFYASDGALVDSEVVTITVTEAGNQPPVLALIGGKSVIEGGNLTFTVTASDPDATIPALSVSLPLPAHAGFTDNGNGTGTFIFNPSYIQSGTYYINFFAKDGLATDSELVAITVIEAGNQPPVLSAIGNKIVAEGGTLNFGVSATDLDQTTPTLTTSTLPNNAVFTDNGNGTGVFNFSPDFFQAGVYPVTFYAGDGALIDSEIVTITVTNVNRPPVLSPIGNRSVAEGSNLNFAVTAGDLDLTTPILSTSTLPTNAVFVDNLNGTGTFDFSPDFSQEGSYVVTFFANDGEAVDSEIITITVVGTNLPPTLNPIGNKTVAEGGSLNFMVTSSDPDGTIPVMSTSSLPANATFVDHLDRTGSFTFNPSYFQAGVYPIVFYASDGIAVDSELVTITVTNVNRAPAADAGADQANVPVGTTVVLDGSGSNDPDNEALFYDWVQIGGIVVTLSDPTAAEPTFVPVLPGVYAFELTVNDGDLFSAPDTVQVTVINAAPPRAVNDLTIGINGESIELSWSAVTLDTAGLATVIDGYIIYRGTRAYFSPGPADSIGFTGAATLDFADSDLFGANVVGDTLNNYFYVVVAKDVYGNRSAVSNRVGEYDYQITITASTDFSFVCVPFTNSGITTADQLIDSIGRVNVRTVNNYRPSSQSFESRFAFGFGVNFAVVPGGIYQVNAATATIFSVAGSVPAPGTITYPLVTTATTDFSFLTVPFERETEFTTAQEVLNNLPGSFNTLNRYIAGSQSYQSRFAAGFGVNFPVRAGQPYQANAARNDVFPGP